MITTSELLQLMSLLISVAGLFYLIGKDNHGRKNNRPVNRPPEVRPKNLTIGGRFSYGKI